MHTPIIYALDFDGVICDSAVETAITGWKAAVTLWPDMPTTAAPQAIIEQFREVRPMIETGYEAILAVRLLYQGETVENIYADYSNMVNALMDEAKLTVNDLKTLFGNTRDIWIADDSDDWVNMNPLFNGVADKLRHLGRHAPWYVITTKQERFVNLILQAHSIDLPADKIFGLDRNISKVEVLTRLVNLYPERTVYFVEDRLPTLANVAKQTQLSQVRLVFADWGYNTADDKKSASAQKFIIQALPQFLAEFH